MRRILILLILLEDLSFYESENGVLVTLPYFIAQVNELRSFYENGGRKTIPQYKSCKLVLFLFYIRTIMEASSCYPMGSRPIWMDDVECEGHETSLAQCSFNGYGVCYCDNMKAAGVFCS